MIATTLAAAPDAVATTRRPPMARRRPVRRVDTSDRERGRGHRPRRRRQLHSRHRSRRLHERRRQPVLPDARPAPSGVRGDAPRRRDPGRHGRGARPAPHRHGRRHDRRSRRRHDEDGDVIEDTYDWYAQDPTATCGTSARTRPRTTTAQSSTEGSWEAGVDGALPGIVMPADPKVSATGYRQEYPRRRGRGHGPGHRRPGEGHRAVRHVRRRRPDARLVTARTRLVEEKTYARSIGFTEDVRMMAGRIKSSVAVSCSLRAS